MAERSKAAHCKCAKSLVRIKLPIQIRHYDVMNSIKYYEYLSNGLNPFSGTNIFNSNPLF